MEVRYFYKILMSMGESPRIDPNIWMSALPLRVKVFG